MFIAAAQSQTTFANRTAVTNQTVAMVIEAFGGFPVSGLAELSPGTFNGFTATAVVMGTDAAPAVLAQALGVEGTAAGVAEAPLRAATP